MDILHREQTNRGEGFVNKMELSSFIVKLGRRDQSENPVGTLKMVRTPGLHRLNIKNGISE